MLSAAVAESANLGYQGFSGLLNVPTASVIEYGEFQFLYTNQVEANRRFGANEEYIAGNSFNFGLGLYDNFEIVARNLGRKLDEGSDLSANIKLKVPHIPKNWFSLALGVQDLGGAANEYDGEYIVATKDFEQLSFTAGYGQSISSISSIGRMNGAMYGLSVTPTPWLTALAEFDGADTNFGMRLSTPARWLNQRYQLVLTGMISSSNDSADRQKFFGLALRMPLGTNDNSVLSSPERGAIIKSVAEQRAPRSSPPSSVPGTVEDTVEDIRGSQTPSPSKLPELTPTKVSSNFLNKKGALSRVETVLSDFGFENVRVGESGETIVLQFNNSIFNANAIDALGFVLGVLSVEGAEQFSDYAIHMQRNGVTVVRISGNIDDYKAFLLGQQARLPEMLMEVSPHNIRFDGVRWHNEASGSPYWRPRFILKPATSTTLGTEYGVFDFSLALNIAAELPLWKGGVLNGSHNTLVKNSDDYQESHIFSHSAMKTEWKDRYLAQTMILPYRISTMFTLGEMNRSHDWYRFAANETKWDSKSGRHQFGIFSGRYFNKSGPHYNSVMLGRYRYYWDEQDTNIKLTAGQYWGQDVGVVVEVSRFFGDTQIHLNYKNPDNELVEMGISIPLTPRKDMSPRGWQLRGSPSWRYGLQTRIDHKGGNPLSFGLAVNPISAHNLGES